MEAEARGTMELTGYGDVGRSERIEESKTPSMRIGIVNDTGLAREVLRRVVLSSPVNEVAWMAKDGAEAVAAPPTHLI